MAFDAATAERIRAVLASEPNVTEKRMFGGIAFMVGGHMCVGLSDGDLMVRVGPDQHEHSMAQPHARAMDFTGRPMKGFVFVSSEGYATKRTLRVWVERALRFNATLPPK